VASSRCSFLALFSNWLKRLGLSASTTAMRLRVGVALHNCSSVVGPRLRFPFSFRKWLHNEAAIGRSTRSVPERRLSPHLSKLLAQPFFFSGLVRLDRKSTQLVVLNVGLHLTPGGMSLHLEDATQSVSRL